MFINLSNHKSEGWSEEQSRAAEAEWGNIVDYPFPPVSPQMDGQAVREMALSIAEEIAEMKPDAVMCQGEFTLSYALINCLKNSGIKVVAACSERSVVENVDPDGSTRRASVFRFVQFREYC